MDHFWARFTKESVPLLHSISKWPNVQRSLKPGDIVSFMNEKTRGKWPIGKVVDVEINKDDGLVRSALVQVGSSTVWRPSYSLALLLSVETM